ncbi:MFS transporter [Nocardioides sp.]|uniref:MFS transporter n=1 Tax=Nocardioides sp. TaxID=35761 RepID=UPI00262B6226|nr:MFS transporter [Nocardioides sp.]
MSFVGSYARLLDGPRRRALVAAGLIGRMHRSMTNLALMLLIADRAGSYGTAGLIAAASVIGVGLGGPAWSRGVDRHGQRAVIPIALVAGVVSLVGLLLVVELDAPVWTWALGSFAAGATSLDFGTLMRSRWAAILTTEEDKHTALALESILDELSFVLGPALAAMIAAAFGGGIAMTVAVVAAVLGGLVLWDSAERAFVPLAPVAATEQRLRRLLPTGVAPMLLAYAGLGLLFASVDLSSVAAAEDASMSWLSGVIIAAFAGGSVIGGLAAGPLLSSWSPMRRLIVTGLAFAVMLQVLLLASDARWMPLLGLVAGLTTAPLLISAMGYIQLHAEPHRRTEAMAWPSVALSIGVTIGSAATGALIDSADAFQGYRVASLGGVIVGVTVLGVWLWSRQCQVKSLTSSVPGSSRP